ncbi:MAG: transporter substrate-binding domain-containing protein [Myxococcales bacterium]|nr:transporter substrate-binding domain-containing protein [Myxococcales bacterium]
MKLTGTAKAFIALMVIGVVGFLGWKFYLVPQQEKEKQAVAEDGGTRAGVGAKITKDDFSQLKNTPDPDRKSGVSGVQPANLTPGKLNRKLVVGINTWAGHAPGIVANLGMDSGNPGSIYKQRYGLDVDFKIFDDPAIKLTAFLKGDIDIMWDTVDSWANEASRLAEQNVQAKAILQQDWSRGGDGIVSNSSIHSIEDLKGKVIATTQFTPSHWLLLYMLSQSGLTAEDKAQIEKSLVYTKEAPLAAAAFKAKKVDAAVTWEPDLSLAVKARGDEAHVLVSTSAATNVIADCLVARQDIIDKSPETLRDFVHGWFDGIEFIEKDPAQSYELVGKALKLGPDDVSGMLSGLKLTPFADNALFFGLTGNKPQFQTLFDTAFIVWRKQGVITKAVDAKDYMDARFVASLADKYQGQKVVESFKFDPKKPAMAAAEAKKHAIVNKQLTIYFTPGSDEIMPGSYFTLDSLGDMMTGFGNTFLRVEGNTDSKGSEKVNKSLSQKRADSVRKYLVEHHAIPEVRFQTIGKGAADPVAPNDTEAGRQQNRRTDIKVVLNVD